MIKIIAVGTIKEKANKELIQEYIKRLPGFYKPQIYEIAEAKITKINEADVALMMKEESQKIISAIQDKDVVILLDIFGESWTSEQFSDHLDKILDYQSSNITFVIGGSYGVDESIKKRANTRFSLSTCTFPHQLVRLLLVEQLYRWYTIKHKINYHK